MGILHSVASASFPQRGTFHVDFSRVSDKEPKDKACADVWVSSGIYIEQEKQIQSVTKVRDEGRNQQALGCTKPQLMSFITKRIYPSDGLIKAKKTRFPLLKSVYEGAF